MEIGHGTGSLFCLTNKNNTSPESSSWYYPNGSSVTFSTMNTNAVTQNYYRSAILLQHQNGKPDVHGIVFRCEVLDDNNKRQNLFVGIYLQHESREFYLYRYCSK